MVYRIFYNFSLSEMYFLQPGVDVVWWPLIKKNNYHCFTVSWYQHLNTFETEKQHLLLLWQHNILIVPVTLTVAVTFTDVNYQTYINLLVFKCLLPIVLVGGNAAALHKAGRKLWTLKELCTVGEHDGNFTTFYSLYRELTRRGNVFGQTVCNIVGGYNTLDSFHHLFFTYWKYNKVPYLIS